MVQTNEIPNPVRAAAHSAVYDVLLAELRARGHELYPGVRDQQGLADAVAGVVNVLQALAAGTPLRDALDAQEREDAGQDSKPLTRDEILDLRVLAAESRQADAHALRNLRSRREQVLARAGERAETGRLDMFEATFVESHRFNTDLIAWYDQLLASGPSEGEAPAA
jgi:hypothetical protein